MSMLWAQARAGQPVEGLEIVDMHAHIGRYPFAIPDLSVSTLVRTMDRIGVRKVLVSHMYCMSWNVSVGNDAVLQVMRAFPGRVLGYVSLWPSDAAAVQAEVERCLAQGFTGIKLHRCNGFAYTDPGYAPALAIANERRLPVLLHTWGEDCDFAEVRVLAARYPHAAFLMAHAGALREADYIAIAQEYENVYLDPTLSRTPVGLWERLVAVVGVEKLVWGSDVYFFSQSPQIGKILGARLADDVKRALLANTAHRLLDRAQVEVPAR